jgi:stage IV sporulation protein FB
MARAHDAIRRIASRPDSSPAAHYNGAMLLYEPPPSQADLHFRVLGIPVRVHPLFWLITLILGVNRRGGTPPAQLLSWIGVVFASVLIHELGHALVQRRYGGHPWITLHSLGGLASCNDCDRGPWSQIVISLAGPGAGFLLALIVAAAVRLAGSDLALAWGTVDRPNMTDLPLAFMTISWQPLDSEAANLLARQLFWVNVMWGLVNLLPVYPLDGGRVSRELLMLRDPRRGIVASLWVSMITAAGMAAFAILVWRSFFTAAMFGYMAYTNYQASQSYQNYQGRGW